KGAPIPSAAVAGIRRRRQGAVLVIAGPDADGQRAELSKEISRLGVADAVIFTDMLVGNEKLSAFRDADIFALPSHSESFGMSVVEAMAARLPVVISDQVKIWREVQAAGAGLVTRCDADDVAHALFGLLDRSDERRRM